MIWNIDDKRRRPFRWACIDVNIEATCHDNSCSDTDQAPVLALDDSAHVVYDKRSSVSLAEAIGWANQTTCPLTLYIYHQGANGMSFEIDSDEVKWMELAVTFDRALRGRLCSLERLEYGWGLSFGDGHALTVSVPWRIVQNGRIMFASSDDGQQFGLIEPIDGEAWANDAVRGRHIASLGIDRSTADLTLHFDNGARLDIFNHSSGYEGWQANIPVGSEILNIIGRGGGDVSVITTPRMRPAPNC